MYIYTHVYCVMYIHKIFIYTFDNSLSAVLMYTNAKPVRITNSAASWSVNVGFEIYESPIKKLYTNITTSHAIDISGRVRL